jgi:hypothetical protein
MTVFGHFVAGVIRLTYYPEAICCKNLSRDYMLFYNNLSGI